MIKKRREHVKATRAKIIPSWGTLRDHFTASGSEPFYMATDKVGAQAVRDATATTITTLPEQLRKSHPGSQCAEIA
jgi:hypothetical protein